MRILYVSHTHPPEGTILDNAGGMQRVSSQLIDQWKTNDGLQIITHTINAAGQGFIALKTAGFLYETLIRLPHLVREKSIDVVLFSSMVTAALAPLFRSKVAVPMVTINHGRDVTLRNSLYQRWVPRVFNALDGVISVSQATREECIKRGMDPRKGVALANGFNLSTMEAMPLKEQARTSLQQQFEIPLDRCPMLLTVGRKVKRKGHQWFIEQVLPLVTQEVVYVTIGDGPELRQLKRVAKASPLSDRIFLLGRQPDSVLKNAYAAADLFIMPNIPVEGDMEGFGIVLLEANMAHTPAVASNLEGIKDVISDGQNGQKIPPHNAEEFAASINRMLTDDLPALSQRAKQFVRQEFSWTKVANDYERFLQNTVAGVASSPRKKNT